MDDLTTITPERGRRSGRSQTHSRHLQKSASREFHGKSILRPRDGSTGITARRAKVYGRCRKSTKTLSMVHQNIMGSPIRMKSNLEHLQHWYYRAISRLHL